MVCLSFLMPTTSKVSPFLFFSFLCSPKFPLLIACYVSLCPLGSGSVIVGSLEQIFKQEGMRGLYRGLSPTVMALLSNWAVCPDFDFLFFI